MPDKDQLAPQEALDAMAVAPPPDPDADAKAPPPRSNDARLDEALDETMDASDPPSITQPRPHLPPPADDATAGDRSG